MPTVNISRMLRWIQIACGSAAVLLLILFVMDHIVMPIYTRQGSEKPIPDLTGLSQEQAAKRAKAVGFYTVAETPKPGGNVPEGTILEQRPFAGSMAKPGRKIHVIPAMAVQRNLAPDLIGLDIREAQLRCKNIDLLCGTADISYRFSDDVTKNAVIAQSPLPGNVVKQGTVVKLIVSLGAMPEKIYVPYLMEKQLHEARILLRESGLQLGRAVRKETDLYPTGTVIAQSIRSGEEVPPETSIDIVVAVPLPPSGGNPAAYDSLISDSPRVSTSEQSAE